MAESYTLREVFEMHRHQVNVDLGRIEGKVDHVSDQIGAFHDVLLAQAQLTNDALAAHVSQPHQGVVTWRGFVTTLVSIAAMGAGVLAAIV